MPILLLLLPLAPFALYLSLMQGDWFKERRRPGDRRIACAAGLLTFLVVSVVLLAAGGPGVNFGWAFFMLSLPFTLTALMLAITLVMFAFRRRGLATVEAAREESTDAEVRPHHHG